MMTDTAPELSPALPWWAWALIAVFFLVVTVWTVAAVDAQWARRVEDPDADGEWNGWGYDD